MFGNCWCVQCLRLGTARVIYHNLGAADIIGLLGSLLGVAVMRTYEKEKGVDTKVIKK